MTVGKTLRQTPGKAHPGNLNPVPQAVTVNPPCDCTHPIPVTSVVSAAKTNNDNAAIGLDPAIMTEPNHPRGWARAAAIDAPVRARARRCPSKNAASSLRRASPW
ncbi:MAG: hypothetical protein JOZ69_16100 [Myxococcales bacterium]|nr:hypothetical protein [Myxococcales bacterium]